MFYTAVLLLITACGKEEPQIQTEVKQTNTAEITKPALPNPKPSEGGGNKNNPPTDEGTKPNEPIVSPLTPPKESNIAKPEDYYLRQYLNAEWIHRNPETTDFAYDRLNEDADKSLFTSEYLAKYVRFVSSPSGGQYVLTAEDLKDLSISDIKAESTRISLKIKYKGIEKATPLYLSFQSINYYEHKVAIDATRISEWYATGVAHKENVDIYVGHILKYDEQRYAHQSVTATANESDSSVAFQFKLISKKNERELANITKIVKGFRPLSTLAKELVIASSAELGAELGSKYRHEHDISKIEPRLKNNLMNWIKKAQVWIGETSEGGLHWYEDSSQLGSIRNILRGNQNNLANHHYYFVDPRFEIVSIRRDNERNLLYIKLKLSSINNHVFDDLVLQQELMVHLIQPS